MNATPASANSAASISTEHFADRLAAAMDRAGSPACVGLDPVLEKLPAEIQGSQHAPADKLLAFCRGVLLATEGVIGVVKPQAACFERYGAPGVAVLHQFIGEARAAGRVVILDAKRGDIGVTAEHYAYSAFAGPHAADALTVNAYLGFDTIEPYLAYPAAGIFVLVRTSNPGSDAVQSQPLIDSRTIAEMMASHVARVGATRKGRCGLSCVGAVVGATKPADARAMRQRMPDTPFLVPGYGAQGGTIDDVRALWRGGATTPGTGGVVVTASRSVIYAFNAASPDWVADVRTAATRLRDELAALV